jgi:hypothetical protein
MADKGHIIGGGAFDQQGDRHYVVAVIDLDADEPTPSLIPVTFLGHGVAFNPADPTKAAVFEKKGPGACYVDLATGELISTISTPAHRHFYGHGIYSADHSLLYATESLLNEHRRGVLTVRDAKTFEELGTLPTFGTSPHDCLLIDDGKTMVVANGGGDLKGGARPCVTYVDIEHEKLLEKVELKAGRFNAGHLAISSAGDLVVVSAPRDGLSANVPKLGAISLKPKGKPLATVTKPQKVAAAMKGETLSVVIDESRGAVMATHPEGNMVTLWDLESANLKKRFKEFTGPRGVTLTLDGRFFVLSHMQGASTAITLVNSETLEVVANSRIDPAFTSGSHIYTHDLAAHISLAS